MEFLGRLIDSPTLKWVVNLSPWSWAVCEIFHFVGMALLIGTVGILDLRLLGVAKGLPVAQLRRLLPWGVFGYAINVATGIIFVAGDPFAPAIDKLDNLAFQLKMLFMLLAGINVMAFYVTGVSRAVNTVGPGDDAPFSAKIVGAISLFLWIGVIYFGRMIMYSDALYTHVFF